MPAHGVKFLHAAAERHNNLATLLLALCFECGKGVEVCYNPFLSSTPYTADHKT